MRVCVVSVLWLTASAAFIQVPAGALAAEPGVVLNERSCWTRYLRFAPNRFSPALLKAEGARIIDPRAYARLKRQSERHMQANGLDPNKVDWRDHAVLAPLGYRAFNPFLMPQPPENWTAIDFDDDLWVRSWRPFQGGTHAQITQSRLGQYAESVDLKLFRAYYRGRFVVSDPASAGGMTLRLAYNGGARVWLNDEEIARGHLPQGPLKEDTPAEEYPPRAYSAEPESVSPRTLGPVTIPARQLRAGGNVLAIEVRASCFHPVVFKNRIQPNWGGPMRPFPHARLVSVELRCASGSIPSANRRPAGVQVWVEDVHRRVRTTDCLAAGLKPGAVRFVGARNGTYSAQIVVGATKALTAVQACPSDLRLVGGTKVIPSAAVEVVPMVPFPAAEWNMRRLGDERGLAGGFPSQAQLARYAQDLDLGPTAIYDRIAAPTSGAASASVPANACRPFWLRLRIPADAEAGEYRGMIEVSGQGMEKVALPVVAEVVAWSLPQPKDFGTWVGCEENPYGVAKQYGVGLWSDEHFRLVETSIRELARIGNQWLNVPVLARTEFGNKTYPMIGWTRRRDGGWSFDFATMDKYLNLVVGHWGKPRVVQFAVMQGNPPAPPAPTGPQVCVTNEGAAARSLFDVPSQQKQVWTAFARSLYAHMKARGLHRSMYWGAPWEAEADRGLKTLLAQCCPGVYWTAGPHEMMYNGVYAKQERFYKIVTDIRYQGGWPSFRDNMGWKSKTVHLLNPRVGGTAYALHTTSHPFAFRVMVDRALAMGRSGFTRVGADEWAAVHYDGMVLPRWVTGIPVLFLLWPGKAGAEPSARFEALLEGIQEAEARIFLEKAIDAGRLPQALAQKARKVLARHFQETNICQGNSIIHGIEEYHCGWQERSRRLYRMAAEAQAAVP